MFLYLSILMLAFALIAFNPTSFFSSSSSSSSSSCYSLLFIIIVKPVPMTEAKRNEFWDRFPV
jgi:hypothetical protein